MNQIRDEFLIFLAWSIFTTFCFLSVYLSKTPASKFDTAMGFVTIGGFGSMIYILVRLSINFY